jgi:thiol-disulfide isomerase/thioredoxin
LLVQEAVAKFPGKAVFVSENFGASKLAERFGVDRYPAVFVDDVLVAKPRDFGFSAESENSGRYTPWRNAESQAKFKADLIRMINLVLAGKKKQLQAERADASNTSDRITSLPKFTISDLAGRPLTPDQLAGRVVLVEFWATWCPPCRSTLEWLGSLKKQYGDNIAVVALAVDSPEDKVRSTVASLSPDLRWAISDGPTAVAFGDVVAVPTMFLFDRSGKTARVLYGAPPDLHQQVESALTGLLKQRITKGE